MLAMNKGLTEFNRTEYVTKTQNLFLPYDKNNSWANVHNLFDEFVTDYRFRLKNIYQHI